MGLEEGHDPTVAPRSLAYNAFVFFGAIAVIYAGWTTTNPTIYRAGLAFHAIFPKKNQYFWPLFWPLFWPMSPDVNPFF